MAIRNLAVQPSFNGVAAGQTATLTLPVGPVVYHRLLLKYFCTNAGNGNQANTEAHLTGIRLKVNGKVQRTFSAKQLDTLSAYRNRAFQTSGTSALLAIYLSEPWRRADAAGRGEDELAWGTQDVSTFQVEVDINAAATGPTLTASAEVEYRSAVMGPIVKWKTYNQPVAAAGVITNNTLPKIDAYYAIHGFLTAAADLTDVTVTTDQIQRLKGLTGDVNDLMAEYGWAPQTNLIHLDFTRTARVGDALLMVNRAVKPPVPVGDFRIDWNMANANSFTLLTETLGLRD